MFFWPEILVILQGAACPQLCSLANSGQNRLILKSAPANGWAAALTPALYLKLSLPSYKS